MHHREETRTFSIIFLYSGQGGQACNSWCSLRCG
jgi:hypothetical protein